MLMLIPTSLKVFSLKPDFGQVAFWSDDGGGDDRSEL